jgi:hypothetical protein
MYSIYAVHMCELNGKTLLCGDGRHKTKMLEPVHTTFRAVDLSKF